MSLRTTKLKFIWGASKVINARWRLGVWGFYERKQGYPDSGLAVSMRGLLLTLLLLAIMAYVSGATAVFFWLDRREHNKVTYVDVLLLPIRRDEVRVKRGQGYLDEGMVDLKKQRWNAALMKLRLGLARHPQALEPRLILAQFYIHNQRQELALKILLEGMDAVEVYPGQSYFKAYLTLLIQGGDFDGIVDACDRYLAGEEELPEDERHWLLQRKISALLKAERAEEALASLESAPKNNLFNEHRMLVLVELGRNEEAIGFLNDWEEEVGATNQILRLQVRAYREAKQGEKMNQKLAALRHMYPADPRTLAYAIIQQKLAGLDADARSSFDDYMFRFSGFSANLNLLAKPLSEIGEEELLKECLTSAEEQGYKLHPLLMLLTHTHLKKGEWDEAHEVSLRMQTLTPKDAKASIVDAERLLALLAEIALNPAEGPQVILLEHFGKRPRSFDSYRNVVEILVLAKRYDLVLRVIAEMEQRYPDNHALDKVKEDMEAAVAALEAAKPQAIEIEERKIFEEDVFFDELDLLVDGEQWTEAAKYIRDMQQSRPSWLKVRETDVLRLQILVAHEAGNFLEMTLTTRMLLDGSLARSQIVVDYALELKERGEDKDAVRLMKEVQRKTPNHALSRRYLEEWTKSEVTQ